MARVLHCECIHYSAVDDDIVNINITIILIFIHSLSLLYTVYSAVDDDITLQIIRRPRLVHVDKVNYQYLFRRI